MNTESFDHRLLGQKVIIYIDTESNGEIVEVKIHENGRALKLSESVIAHLEAETEATRHQICEECDEESNDFNEHRRRWSHSTNYI